MKVIRNDKLIARNKKISQIVLFSSLGFIALGIFWSLRNPQSKTGSLSYLVLIPAYILVQISIYLSNRWGRSPRPDEIVTNSLKGLNNEYTLFIYQTDVPHLLLGPAGLIIINPYHQSGEVTFDQEKGKFKQKGGANFITKLFGQENIPNIVRESIQLNEDFSKYLKKIKISSEVSLEIINIFHSIEAEVHAENAPYKTIHARKLKVFIRKKAKSTRLNKEVLESSRKKILKYIKSS